MNTTERTKHIAAATGLSRAKVNQFRQRPVGHWTTTADRRIGSAIRTAERLAHKPEISWDQWMEKTGQIFAVLRSWVSGAMDKVAHFAERIGRVVTDVLQALAKVLKHTAKIVTAVMGAGAIDPSSKLATAKS